MGYDVEKIIAMDELEHIRNNRSMYIGNTESATHLLLEAFDNAVDETLAGAADIIAVFIDREAGTISVLDNGRGFPFDQSLSLESDPPVLASTKLFTSGKFKKNEDSSAYKIASGLHGIGLVAVYALSEWMEIEIYRDGKHALYRFDPENITRNQEAFKGSPPFGTKITMKPDKKYFTSTDVDYKYVEERMRIAVANFPNLKMVFRIDGQDKVIKGTEKEMIDEYLSKSVENWYTFESQNKLGEKCYLKFGWEPTFIGKLKTLSAVNLVRVHTGVHCNKAYNILRSVFQGFAKKHKFSFLPDDCLQGCRIYLNLHIVNTAFDAQVKTRLEASADISIIDPMEKMVRDYFNKNPDVAIDLMTHFQIYRDSIQSKKLTKGRSGNRVRSNVKFTKLRDCSQPGGELLIGEGDSAVGGIIRYRSPKMHAILPLRGVIPNALTMTSKKLLDNAEVKDIVHAIGTGIGEDCDISKLRYDKIILTADADPAGHWITSLLIILFAKLVPDVIKNNHLFVCRTPLYGTYKDNKFQPLWNQKQLDEARKLGNKIERFKGLGEFSPKDLKVFTLDKTTRILIPVNWSTNIDRIFDLFTKPSEKRKLVLGEWKL